MLETTPIDTSLDLDLGTLGPEHISTGAQKPLKLDKLWQIRLLLSLADKMEAENNQKHKRDEGNRTWLRNKVIEKLRWRIWKMSGSGGTEREHKQAQSERSRTEGSDLLE